MPGEDYPRLISLAVHELRTPVGVVGGYLRMLQRDSDPLSERQRKMVDEAAKSCARLVSLIAELSEVGKLDERSIPMAARPVDLFTLVAEVADSVHTTAERAVRLEVQGASDGAQITGDSDRLRAAFGAVFQAILREKPEPCTMAVDRRIVQGADGTSAIVVLADSDNVHAAYDSPRTAFDDKRGGVGLSLAIARRVIEAHGGSLWSPGTAGRGRQQAGVAADERAARGAALIQIPIGSAIP
jgi:signal transduction histidine kinase